MDDDVWEDYQQFCEDADELLTDEDDEQDRIEQMLAWLVQEHNRKQEDADEE